jgi:hypothetical protein
VFRNIGAHSYIYIAGLEIKKLEKKILNTCVHSLDGNRCCVRMGLSKRSKLLNIIKHRRTCEKNKI